jgi:hypothetical protein
MSLKETGGRAANQKSKIKSQKSKMRNGPSPQRGLLPVSSIFDF